MELQISRCRQCRAQIVFIRTLRGKMMPCQPKAVPFIRDPQGPSLIMTRGGELVKAQIMEQIEDGEALGYLPHWKYCPGAEAMRQEQARRAEPAKPKAAEIPKQRAEEPKAKWNDDQVCLFGRGSRLDI